MKHIVLRLTERCNLACAYCYARGGEGGRDMPEDMAIRAVALACAPGDALKIQFTGGEPLLCLDTIRAVYAFGKSTGRRLQLAVQTNGTLLDEAVCRALKGMRIGVGVSLDGGRAANGYRVTARGENAFGQIVRGIAALSGEGMAVNMTAVISDLNARALDDVLDTAFGLGNVHALGFDVMRPIGRAGGGNFAPQEAALVAGLEKLFARYAQLDALGAAPRLRELERARRKGRGDYCYAQTQSSLAVDPKGYLYPCSSLVGEAAFALGHIDEGFEKASRPRPALAPQSECLACARFEACRGGCPAAGAAEGCKSSIDCQLHAAFADFAARQAGG